MRGGQGRPTLKKATNVANTADILLLETFPNRNSTQSHSAKPARGGLVQLGSISQVVPTTCWKLERGGGGGGLRGSGHQLAGGGGKDRFGRSCG